MWAYIHHFHSKDINDGCVIFGYGVEVKFNQSRRASFHDHNITEGKLGYFRKDTRDHASGPLIFPVCHLSTSGGIPSTKIM